MNWTTKYEFEEDHPDHRFMYSKYVTNTNELKVGDIISWSWEWTGKKTNSLTILPVKGIIDRTTIVIDNPAQPYIGGPDELEVPTGHIRFEGKKIS